jgi:DNA mismatch repair ATPase MutS
MYQFGDNLNIISEFFTTYKYSFFITLNFLMFINLFTKRCFIFKEKRELDIERIKNKHISIILDEKRINMESDFNQKLDDIESILAKCDYNGSEWTMELLKKKADELALPKINWKSKSVLAYFIKTTEQLSKIGKIIEPMYQYDYDADELEDN